MPDTGSDGVVPERVGAHLVVRGADDPAREREFLHRLPAVPGRLFVLPARALSRSTDQDAVHAALGEICRNAGDAEVWLAVEGLGADHELLASLAGETGAVVLAPAGRLAFASGCTVLASGDGGAPGWWRTDRGAEPAPAGWRFPPAGWEAAMPGGGVVLPGGTATPVMAGLAVRGGDTPVGPRDLAFHVVGGLRAPRIVVADPCPAPDSVALLHAQLVAGLPAEREPVVVALTRAVVDPEWLDRFAAAAGGAPLLAPAPSLVSPDGLLRTVALDDAGQELFDPFPTVLRLLPGGAQAVVAAAPPPPGWVATGPTTYVPQPPDGPVDAEEPSLEGVCAHVVADGLVVSRRGAPEPDPGRRFDAAGWKLELGVDGEPLDEAVVVAAYQLLESVGPARRGAVRVITPLTRRPDPGATADPVTDPASGTAATPEPDTTATPEPDTTATPEPDTTATPEPGTAPDPAIVTAAPAPDLPPPPPRIETATAGPAPVVEPAPPRLPTAPAVWPDGAAWDGGPGAGPEADVAPADRGTGPLPVEERIPATALRVADRASTTAERSRFSVASGEGFTEALAAVNAAAATWPALRGDGDDGVKADLAAVYLYLAGRDGTRAGAVDDAVRQGSEGVVDGHLACLVSGLRRLPVHRRPVLRLGVDEVAADQGTPGRMLGEAAFLTASTDLDITVPDARYDVLIMPATARRTAELIGDGPVAEAVFPAGSRYRTLGLRTLDDVPAAETSAAPGFALLLRELSPDEDPDTADDLDERDRSALRRLERALAGRRRAAVRLVEDPPVVARLTRRLAVVTPEEMPARSPASERSQSERSQPVRPQPVRSAEPVTADAGR